MRVTIDLNGDELTAEVIVEAAERASKQLIGRRRATQVQYSGKAIWSGMAHGITLPWFMGWGINDAIDDAEVLLCADDNTALGRIVNFAIPEED